MRSRSRSCSFGGITMSSIAIRRGSRWAGFAVAGLVRGGPASRVRPLTPSCATCGSSEALPMNANSRRRDSRFMYKFAT